MHTAHSAQHLLGECITCLPVDSCFAFPLPLIAIHFNLTGIFKQGVKSNLIKLMSRQKFALQTMFMLNFMFNFMFKRQFKSTVS